MNHSKPPKDTLLVREALRNEAATWIRASEDPGLPVAMKMRALDLAEELILKAHSLK